MVFGISNMSEDELVSRLNYFQGDPLRFNGNLFWCNRASDYLNRMTILVGYMKKYGCYDAYEFKDNQLMYNWKRIIGSMYMLNIKILKIQFPRIY